MNIAYTITNTKHLSEVSSIYATSINWHSLNMQTSTVHTEKGEKMSAYSDWKCGAITEQEYKDYCRWEDDRDKALEEYDREEEVEDE